MPKKLPLHPLINQQDSPHYQEPDAAQDSESAIERFERKYTVTQLMNWAEISKAKYDDPGRAIKGEQEKDLRKSKTYEDYYTMLRSLVLRDQYYKDMIAKDVYTDLKIHWRYR